MINRIRTLVTGAARGGAPARGRSGPAPRRAPAGRGGSRGGQGAGGLASKATRLLRRR